MAANTDEKATFDEHVERYPKLGGMIGRWKRTWIYALQCQVQMALKDVFSYAEYF